MRTGVITRNSWLSGDPPNFRSLGNKRSKAPSSQRMRNGMTKINHPTWDKRRESQERSWGKKNEKGCFLFKEEPQNRFIQHPDSVIPYQQEKRTRLQDDHLVLKLQQTLHELFQREAALWDISTGKKKDGTHGHGKRKD